MHYEGIEMNIEGDTLRIGGAAHTFGNVIDKCIEFDDFVVVLLGLTGDEYSEIKQNVVAIDRDGSIRWRIEKAPEKGHYDAYADIFEDDGELRAYNLSGMNYKVDKETGDVSDGTFVK